MTTINNSIQKMHKLSQLLAAFGNSYLPVEKDDSQATLEWHDNGLSSKKIEGVGLFLSYAEDAIFFKSNAKMEKINTPGKSIQEIYNSIKDYIGNTVLDKNKYKLKFNYELNFNLSNNEKMGPTMETKLKKMAYFRQVAQQALQTIKEEQKHTSSILIWPHHFDTGLLVGEDSNLEKGFGLGYAIADHVCELPYYYVYNYPKLDIDYSKVFDSAIEGMIWKNIDSWKGSLLPANEDIKVDKVIEYYQESIQKIVDYK